MEFLEFVSFESELNDSQITQLVLEGQSKAYEIHKRKLRWTEKERKILYVLKVKIQVSDWSIKARE